MLARRGLGNDPYIRRAQSSVTVRECELDTITCCHLLDAYKIIRRGNTVRSQRPVIIGVDSALESTGVLTLGGGCPGVRLVVE